MSLRRTQFPQNCITLIACLFVAFWFFPSPCSADDLFVGNFFGPGHENVLRYNGTTGAFISVFVPDVSFPLGGAFGLDGNLYVTNSDTETVLRFDGTTGAFINNFATSVDDAAGLAFGPANNLFVANSASPGSVTELNATTGGLINTLTAGGALSNPEGVTLGPDKNLYVANGDGNNVLKFNGTTAAFMGVFVAAGSGGLLSARDVAFGPDGDLCVTSFGPNQVLRFDRYLHG
jgi:DNA-binding beta-propeller fold protein YncE